MNGTHRILAAEDSKTQGEMLRAGLVEAGFDVTLAESGEAALECFGTRAFDLVLSDVVMPGMDGYELCRRIKEADPDIPVIILTSLTDPLEIVRGLEAGADNFLRKPYQLDRLVERLRTVTYHRSMRASGRVSMGLEVMLRDKRFLITAERQQILDLLLSSFEDLVVTNGELREREDQLVEAQQGLSAQLVETERERARLEGVLANVPEPMVIVDPSLAVTEASERLCALLGMSSEALVGRSVVEVAHFVDADGRPINGRDSVLPATIGDSAPHESGGSFDLFLELPEGRREAVVARAAPVQDASGKLIAAVGVFQEIGHLADFDPVTKLPNRNVLADRVHLAVARSAQDSSLTVVMGAVLERLARLRESMTTTAVDSIRRQVASGLVSWLESEAGTVNQTDSTLAGVTDDSFVVVIPGVREEVDAIRLANSLHTYLDVEYDSGDMRVAVNPRVGLAVNREAGDPGQLVGSAVGAARRAIGPNGVAVADPEIDAIGGAQLRREAELARAIAQGELVVHYQPKLVVGSGRVVGAEALVRWEHPERGLVGPLDFIDLARDSGHIVPLGWWVLDEVCRQVAEWRVALPGAERLTVQVNMDAQQLDADDLLDRIVGALGRNGVPAEALMLEITESGVVADIDHAAERLAGVKALGVRIALDDFGTGYSSLVHLRRLPVDELKIDRSFVAAMGESAEDAAIVAATIRLGRALGMDTVAEGVETEETLVQLRLLGCDLAQGYLWSRPLPPEEFEQYWSGLSDARAFGTDGDANDGDDDEESAQLEESVAYLIHELRTPLTAIAGFAELAVDATPEDRAGFLDTVVRNAKDLEARLALLAEMREVREGRIRLALETVDLGETLCLLVNDLAPQLAPHPVEMDAPSGVIARADGRRLGQALTNLLTNAAKFSPPAAPIEVTVETRGSNVEIAVRDFGPGIPPERRGELFRRFARLGSRAKGMGVGLYLVRAICRAHGGDVRYELAPGGGSRFVMSIPAG